MGVIQGFDTIPKELQKGKFGEFFADFLPGIPGTQEFRGHYTN